MSEIRISIPSENLVIPYLVSGLSLELSDREKFCDIFRILGRSFGSNFGFLFMFYTLKLLPQLREK